MSGRHQTEQVVDMSGIRKRSTDSGITWSNSTVGQGAFPTIAFDPDGDLWMVWMGKYETDAHFTGYRRILCSRYSHGSWSAPETLQTYHSTEQAVNTESDSLQCVSFSTDSTDTGHVAITYKKKVIYPDTVATAYHYLDYVVFETDTPIDSISYQQVRSSTMVQPIGLATIAADSANNAHIAWEKRDIDPIYGSIRIILHSVGPAFLTTDTVSDIYNDSYHPYIDCDDSHDRMNIVWDADSNSVFQVYSRFWHYGPTGWETETKKVSTTSSDSRLPVISESYALWSEWDGGVPKKILKSKYGRVAEAWLPADTVSESDSPSLYVHTLNVPKDSLLLSCWTEGDSASYWIPFNLNTSSGLGGVPSYYVDAGRPIVSPYLRHRDGYLRWGDEPELTADTDGYSVSYAFGRLDPDVSYKLRTVHYYEPSERAPGGNPTTSGRADPAGELNASSARMEHHMPLSRAEGRTVSSADNLEAKLDTKVAPFGAQRSIADASVLGQKNSEVDPKASKPWMMGIELDGQTAGTVELPVKSVKTFECEIPRALTKDGALTLDVSRLRGDYALVSEIYLYEAGDAIRRPVNTGPQLVAGANRHRFRFHVLAPNPSRGRGTMRYELATSCDVRVDVFDVAGRVVATLTKPGVLPGTQEIIWGAAEDLDTQTFATGTYFVRLTALNAKSGIREFSLTRNLVLIR